MPTASEALGPNLITSKASELRQSFQLHVVSLSKTSWPPGGRWFMTLAEEKEIDKQEHLNGFKLPVNDCSAGA